MLMGAADRLWHLVALMDSLVSNGKRNLGSLYDGVVKVSD